jgi:hypothetical protein
VVESGDPTWPYASEVVTFSMDLSDAGTDVLIRFEAHSDACTPFCGPRHALMIDDLRLE